MPQHQRIANVQIFGDDKELEGWILSVRGLVENGLSPQQRALFREEFFPERELKIYRNGSSNVLVVAPHGFPGDDDHTDYLAYFLAKELDASYLINNKAFHKPGKEHPMGEPANLNQPWSSNAHTRRFVALLLEMTVEVASRSKAPPLVLCIHGMSDANARRLHAGDFCIGAGYTIEEREKALAPGGWATASREVIQGILDGLSRRGYRATDGVRQYCAKRAIPGYLKSMEKSIGPSEAVQIEVRYLGLRDPLHLVKTAVDMALVIRELEAFRAEPVKPAP